MPVWETVLVTDDIKKLEITYSLVVQNVQQLMGLNIHQYYHMGKSSMEIHFSDST